ncbi:type II secretion system protein GspM [uncultured Hyphomonas sp.]|uniref:type II secretion system protein GspM n=1 Tax=uncultured Hyphomonas sp. TaxID=225298 RepID=UPI002AAB13D4|nr:type II secretion system protein GspM [uncultured Hyphomonas sp.]
MIEYWSTRSVRERLLILVAGVLVAVLLTNLLVVRPLRAAKESASTSLAVASRTLDAVSASRPMANAGGAPGATGVAAQDLRSRLVELAANRGISVSRLQSNERGAIIIQFDQVSVQPLFAWLEAAERELGAEPAQASVFADAGGTVRASFEFRGGAL